MATTEQRDLYRDCMRQKNNRGTISFVRRVCTAVSMGYKSSDADKKSFYGNVGDADMNAQAKLFGDCMGLENHESPHDLLAHVCLSKQKAVGSDIPDSSARLDTGFVVTDDDKKRFYGNVCDADMVAQAKLFGDCMKFKGHKSPPDILAQVCLAMSRGIAGGRGRAISKQTVDDAFEEEFGPFVDTSN